MSKPSGLKRLQNELNQLHACWLIYDQLFTKREAIELQEDNGGAAWRVLRLGLHTAIILGFSRLVDPATSRGRAIVSFPAVVNHFCEIGENDFARELGGDLKKLRKRCRKMEQVRNRVYAHVDLRTALGADSLPEVAASDIESALNECRELTNKISKYLGEPPALYDRVVMVGDGHSLLDVLDRADYHHWQCEYRDWHIRVDRQSSRDNRRARRPARDE
jgi:hypothetical protein